MRGDAGDAQLVGALGGQEIVVANRFLCQMTPAAAEKSLRNIGRLVKTGRISFRLRNRLGRADKSRARNGPDICF